MKQFIVTCLVLMLFTSVVYAGAYGDFQNDAYTVALYYFEGDAIDETGVNDGSVSGATLSQFGKFGQAYDFSGVNQYILVQDDPSISGLTAVTVEVWVMFDTVEVAYNTYPIIIGKGNWADNREYRLRMESSTYLVWHVSSNGSDPGSQEIKLSISSWNTGVWYYLAGTYDSVTDMLYLYCNGDLIGSASYTSNGLYDGPANLGIGGYGNAPLGDEFNGKIDSVRISNIIRNADEIREYYRLSQGAYGIIE